MKLKNNPKDPEDFIGLFRIGFPVYIDITALGHFLASPKAIISQTAFHLFVGQLRMDVDILKKASAFFAREMK